MPELPEVEFATRRLREWFVGRRVEEVRADPGKPLRDLTPPELVEALTLRTVERVERIGKQMLVRFEGGRPALLVHLGMTGKFLRHAADAPERPGTRFRLFLDDGHRLDFLDMRRFGRVYLVADEAAARAHPALAKLGPDALELSADPKRFAQVMGQGKRALKVALMDQSRLAGVGNIYALEALWEAKLDPFAPCDRVKKGSLRRLAEAVHEAMRASIARELDDEILYLPDPKATNPFEVYGRDGEPCPRCATPIVRITQQGRGTFWCPPCQKGQR